MRSNLRSSLSILVFVLCITGIANAQEPRTWDIRLTWDANTEEDLVGYRLYRSSTSGAHQKGEYVKSIQAGTEEYVDTVGVGTYFWALTAFDTSNNESGFSNEVTVTLDEQAPAAPGGLNRFLQWLQDLFAGSGMELKQVNVVLKQER